MTTLDADKLANLRKFAGRLSLMLWVGVFGMGLSLTEGSWVWATYCVLTGWIGIVMGLAGGAGYADHLMGRTPVHRRASKLQVTLLSLLTYWIPTLAVLVYGMILAGALREDLQPASFREHAGIRTILEAAAMYFTAAGTTWAVVAREAKIVQATQADTNDTEDTNDNENN